MNGGYTRLKKWRMKGKKKFGKLTLVSRQDRPTWNLEKSLPLVNYTYPIITPLLHIIKGRNISTIPWKKVDDSFLSFEWLYPDVHREIEVEFDGINRTVSSIDFIIVSKERIHRIFIEDILIPSRLKEGETVNLSVIGPLSSRPLVPKGSVSVIYNCGQWLEKRTKDETVWGRRKGYTIPFTKVNFCQSWGNRRRYLCVCGYTQCRCWRWEPMLKRVPTDRFSVIS